MFVQVIMLKNICFEPELTVTDCGTVDYDAMLARQRQVFNSLIAEKRACGHVSHEYIFMVEHPDVITLGRHADHANLLVNPDYLRHSGVSVVEIDRGGDVTYHGPGQLVVYPVIDISLRHLGVRQYVETLEEAVIRTISHWDIKGERVEGATGVWKGKGTPQERKICAIGIRCSRYITMHGLALNVNTDLSKFQLINPCGFIDKGVTSMQKEVGEEVDLSRVKQVFIRELLHCLSGNTPHSEH